MSFVSLCPLHFLNYYIVKNKIFDDTKKIKNVIMVMSFFQQ